MALEDAAAREQDDKGSHLPRVFPTRPRNCVHHVIPYSLFTADLVLRLPSNFQFKKELIAKHGNPMNMAPNQVWSILSNTSNQSHPVYMTGVNLEDIPAAANPNYTRPPAPPRIHSSAATSKAPTTATSILRCHFCDKKYKHMGTLKRHYKVKHDLHGKLKHHYSSAT
jgi:hypothetical protein